MLAAVRSVMLNLANRFSQCSFSVAEHRDLFSDLIILRQAWWRQSYDDMPHRPQRTDRETAAGKAEHYHTDPEINLYTPYHAVHDESTIQSRRPLQIRRNNRRRRYTTATPTR